MLLRIICFFMVSALVHAQTYLTGLLTANPALPLNSRSTTWIGYPDSLQADAVGNIYFTSLHCVFKLTVDGSLIRFAGSGLKGFSGDGGPATAARLFAPAGVAIDGNGTGYVADSGNNRVRRITADGIITTVAGSGSAGFDGDTGPAVAAKMDQPVAVATDLNGQLFVLDLGNNRVRVVSPDGVIRSFAGNGTIGDEGDGGPARSASLVYPTGMAVNASGDLFLADAGNHRIRRVSRGIITTVAGNGSRGFDGDGGPAVDASLNFPDGVKVDAAGNIYISDSENARVRKVTPAGVITTLAGSGTQAYGGDGGTAAEADLNFPNDVAVDGRGTVYIADSANGRIRAVSASGRIATVAGSSAGPAIGSVDALAIGPRGEIYYADSFRDQVYAVAGDGTLQLVAGSGTRGFDGDQGRATNAQLNLPLGLAGDNAGNLFISDSGNQRVRKVAPSGTITTVAGTGVADFSGDGGPATAATLNYPGGLAVDNAGNLFVADSGNHRVRRITPNGTISTVAGSGVADFTGDNGPATSAALHLPGAVAVDGSGNLFIADELNGRIRRVSTAGVISTIASYLDSPGGVASDQNGNVFVADTMKHVIRRFGANGTAGIIAGSGQEGYSGDGVPATLAQFSRPAALVVDSAGKLIVADSGNTAIRSLQVSPQSVVVAAVADAASGSSGAISPGKIVVIYGAGLGPDQLALFPGTVSSVPKDVADTSVAVNGISAPVIYTSATQAAAIVPYGVSGSAAEVTVSFQGRTSLPTLLPVAASSPGLFTANSSGTGQAAAINVSTGTLNSAVAPVRAGDYIALYATGEGQTTTAADGKLAGLPLPLPLQPIAVTVGGVPAVVQYAGGVFGTVAGLMQINVLVPAGTITSGYVPVMLKAGGIESTAGVWISVAGR